jgi:coenzyme F420-0:L-glutamate ligase/coenzyme F420-1:gamma-L-glutamate ligase
VTSPLQLILTAIADIPLISQGDDLAGFILQGLSHTQVRLQDGDIMAIAQKVVSKAEGRLFELAGVIPSRRAIRLAKAAQKDARLVDLILSESQKILRVRPGLIIVEHRLGFICANAGVDASNVRGPVEKSGEYALLLPTDPDASARRFRERFLHETGARIGVLIIDSHGRAWREGAVGVAIGVAGLPALLDLRGRPDLFGRLLQTTQVGLADEVAAAASVLMGQAAEGRPVIHIRGLPYPLREGSLAEILRPKEKDLFR